MDKKFTKYIKIKSFIQIKEIVRPKKINFYNHVITFMQFQTCLTLVPLWNTKENIFYPCYENQWDP